MGKKKRQNLLERERNKKRDGTISKMQLISCYVSSALIVVICLQEANTSVNPSMYYLLAVLGVAFSVYITIRNNNAQKKAK